jgi:C-terminal processing protease CtpA/Prc
MIRSAWTLLLVPTLAAGLARQEAPASTACAANLLERAVVVLEERYYDQDFRETRLPGLAARYRPRAEEACSLAEQRTVAFEFLSEIPASHLSLFSGTSYRRILDELWGRPSPTVGFELVELDGKHFASNVVDGGPAAEAGLLPGDRVLTIDGRPVEASGRLDWRTDDAYLDDPPLRAVLVEDGDAVELTVERRPGERRAIRVSARPYSLLEASRASARVYERGDLAIGYFHLWLVQFNGISDQLRQKLETQLAASDALVLDLRGRGGNGATVPRLLEVLDDWRAARDVPLVVLIDRGTRSAKEVITHELRKRERTLLVGERTAGAAIPAAFEEVGEDTYLMFPPFEFPGYTEALEGRGIEPDIHLASSGPYSAGRDAILEAGLREAARLAAAADGAGQAAPRLPAYAEVRAKMIEALGGEAAIRRHSAMTQTGTFEVVGLPLAGTLLARYAAPYYFLLTVELDGVGRVVQGYDGAVGWSENPSSGRTVLEGNDLARLRGLANYYGPLAFEEYYETIELVGRTEFNGTPCYELSLSYGEGGVRTLFVDTASYLVAGSKDTLSTPAGPVEAITTLAGYQEFDGLQVATQSTTDIGGLQQQKVVITSVSFDPLEPGTFEPPDWAVR